MNNPLHLPADMLARTSETDRKHDAQGIGDLCGPTFGGPTSATSTRDERYELMWEFIQDCASPDCYAHALPMEVVKRAGQIKRIIEGSRPGYGQPPPARCAACDDH